MMNIDDLEGPGLINQWILVSEHKKPRRLCFSSDRLYIVNALNKNIQYYVILEVIIIGALAGFFIFRRLAQEDYTYGLFQAFIFGAILGGLTSLVSQLVSLKLTKNKLNQITPFVALSLDKKNYTVNYPDVSAIELKTNNRSFPLGKNHLYIVSAYGTYKYGISKKYVPEVKRIIEKIEIPKPKVSKQRKKLKLKTPQPDKN
jgi:hypothetical protein